MIEQLLQNPAQIAVLVIRLFLGFGLGYVTARAFKYIIAFIAILALGMLLNAWSLGFSLEDMFAWFGAYAMQVKDFFGLAQTILLIIGPTAIGFIIGVLIAKLIKS